MTDWRLLAERPAFDPSVPLPEVLRPLVIFVDYPRVIDRVILLDPSIPSGQNWLNVFEIAQGEHRRFLSWVSDPRPNHPTKAINRLYVPAAEGTGFHSESPRYEGHWRTAKSEASALPWPQPHSQWGERAAFLTRLDLVEATAPRIAYRGISMCRLCGAHNGHEAFRSARWEWPAGFRHYLVEHEVEPSPEFKDFIYKAEQP